MRAKASKWKPALLVLSFFLFAHSAHAESIKAIHQPPDKVDENVAVELTVSLTSKTRVKEMRLRYRFPGEKRYHKIKGYQKNKRWWLVLPASEIKPPFIEYFIVGQSYKGRSHLVFASPQKPHRLLIGLQPTSFQSPSDKALQQIDSKSLQPSIPTPSKNKTEEKPRKEDLPLDNNDTDKQPPQASVQTPTPSPSQIIRDEPVVEAGGLFSSFFQGEDKSKLGAGYTQEASKAPGYASKMGRERIQALGARDLMDIIKSFPEMDTALSVSGFDLVNVRGIQNDARILLVVDGQPLSNPYDGRNYWNLSANQIEQVEVLRGAAGALYGAGAVSAVVLVTTRRHTGLNLFVEGGSFNTFRGGLSVGKTKGNHSGAVNANIEYTSGPSLPIASDALSEANVQRSEEDMLTHASGLSGGITGAYDYDIGQSKRTTLSARFQMFGEQRGPYIGYFDTVGPESNLNWLLWSGQGTLKHRFSPNTELSWKIYGGQNVVDRLLQLAPKGFSTPDRDGDGNAEAFADGVFAQTSYDTINWGTEGRFDLRPSKEHHVVTGVRFNVGALPENNFVLRFNRDLNGVAQGLDTVENLDMPQNELCRIYGEQVSMGLSACRLTLAAFVQEDWRPTDSFAATLGLRFSSLSDLDFDLASHLTPRLALVWEPVSRWTIKTSAATAFRAPTLEEKYDQTPLAFSDQSAGLLLGNESLQSELVSTFELGTGYDFQIGKTGYQFYVNSFATHVGQVIEHIDDTGTLSDLINQEGYDMFGVSGEARVGFEDGHFLFVNSSWHRVYWGRETADDSLSCGVWPWETSAETCTLVTDVPQLRTNAGAFLQLDHWGSLSLYGHLGSMRKNNWRSQLEQMRTYEIPAYSIANMVYQTPQLGEGLLLRFLARNIFQEDIKDPVPRPDADRMPGLLPRAGFEAFAQLIWQN